MTEQIYSYPKTYYGTNNSFYRSEQSKSPVINVPLEEAGTKWTGFTISYGTDVPLSYTSSPQAKLLQKRIKERWPSVLSRAKDLEFLVSNPIDSLSDLFQDISQNLDISDILNEPYG